MRNKFAIVMVCTLLIATVLGCSSVNPFTDKGKNTSPTASNTVVGDETTGVPECDEVMDMIAAEANNPDDGYIVKATKALFLNKIKESIRKSIEENKNKNGTADLAKTCTEYKKQLEKYKAEEEKKKS